MILSKALTCLIKRSIKEAKKRLSKSPSTTGSKICKSSSKRISAKANVSLFAPKNKLIQSGVKKMPMTPDMLALKIAPGILPRAMETITTEEEMVEGSAAMKNTASHNNAYGPSENIG